MELSPETSTWVVTGRQKAQHKGREVGDKGIPGSADCPVWLEWVSRTGGAGPGSEEVKSAWVTRCEC